MPIWANQENYQRLREIVEEYEEFLDALKQGKLPRALGCINQMNWLKEQIVASDDYKLTLELEKAARE